MMVAYKREWRGAIHAAYTSPAWGFGVEKLRDIKDGTSNTLMVGESTTSTAPARRTFWAYSFAYYTLSGATSQQRTLGPITTPASMRGGAGGEIPCKRQWGSFHPGGMNFVFCDGGVHFIHTTINLDLFGNLASIAGGEPATSATD